MPGRNTHVLHDVEAAAFAGNDVIRCQTVELGTDTILLRAPVARLAGSFVRLQCHLDPEHWLDADAVLSECNKFGNEWHWRLAFVSVREPPPLRFAGFINRHAKRSSLTHPPPAPPSSPAPASRPTNSPPGESAPPLSSRPPPKETHVRFRGRQPDDASPGENMNELFREALKEVEGKR